jgi:hypothetical protein
MIIIVGSVLATVTVRSTANTTEIAITLIDKPWLRTVRVCVLLCAPLVPDPHRCASCQKAVGAQASSCSCT